MEHRLPRSARPRPLGGRPRPGGEGPARRRRRPEAAPFDAVLPRGVLVDSRARSGVGIGAWGWLIATRRTLWPEDLRAARCHAEVEDDRIRAGMRLLNVACWAPLRPREVAGPLVLERARYTARLTRSERFRDSLVEAWGLALDFRPGLEVHTRLHVQLTLAGHRLAAEMRLSLGSYEADAAVEGAQRCRADSLEAPAGADPGAAALISSAR